MTYLGYCLTGETREQIFCNFSGAGSNGKGSLIGLIKKIMGSYAGVLSTEAILQRGNNRFSLGNITGLRIMFAPDVPKGTLNMENIKTLTGEDTIRIEQKYRDPFDYRPQAKLIFSTNYPLHLTEHGAAIRRRLRLIPFDFTPPEPDKALEAKLEAEAPFILDQLIKYAVQYYKEGFPPCRTVEDASNDFVDSQDTVKQFLNECTTEETGASCGKTELYIAYKNWETGQETDKKFIMTNKSFWNRINKMYTDQHTKQGNIYHDIKLNQ
jgi:putative DNA primase/helicase